MSVLIVTDVFGLTPAVASLVRTLACPCSVISPYSEANRYFKTEQMAYQAFLAEGGVAAYAQKILNHLQNNQEQFSLSGHSGIHLGIAFSAGASALWLASSDPQFAHFRANILFYGSRIRDHQEIMPVCPTRLIFAEHETAFNATTLTQQLQKRGHQAELVKHTRHGFMNPYSSGFCVKTQSRFLDQLSEIIQANDMLVSKEIEIEPIAA